MRENIIVIRKIHRTYYLLNKKAIIKKQSEYYQKNKEKVKKRTGVPEMKTKLSNYNQEYYLENRDKILQKQRDLRMKKKLENPQKDEEIPKKKEIKDRKKYISKIVKEKRLTMKVNEKKNLIEGWTIHFD